MRTDPVHLNPEGDLAGDQLLSQVVILLLQADQRVPELLVLTLHKEKTMLLKCLSSMGFIRPPKHMMSVCSLQLF